MGEHLPLAGITAVDLTTFLSGPSATQLLGDLGADVIKVESLSGDSSRGIAGPKVDGVSAYYLANNRNKRSIAVDLKTPEGLKIVEGLIARADVVVENFRPGVCTRLGIDPAAMRERHPALIWASISGFGQSGPLSGRPAYDMVVQALSGVMSITGHPGGPAARLGIPAGDVVAGLYSVIGILAALADRAATGTGRIVDVSMLQGQLAMLSYQAVYASVTGLAPGPQGAAHDSIATYRAFMGGDGREFVVTANTDRMWQGLCRATGLEHLLNDDRYSDASRRLVNREALWSELDARFKQAPASEWVQVLLAEQVPVAAVKNVLEALADAREIEGALLTITDGAHGFENVATPIKFDPASDSVHRYPPRLGGDTADILRDDLGFHDDEIGTLIAAGVVTDSTERLAVS